MTELEQRVADARIAGTDAIWHQIAEWRGKWNGEGAPEVEGAIARIVALERAEARVYEAHLPCIEDELPCEMVKTLEAACDAILGKQEEA